MRNFTAPLQRGRHGPYRAVQLGAIYLALSIACVAGGGLALASTTATAVTGTVSVGATPVATAPPAGVRTVDPANPGAALPAVGRSLFDHLFAGGPLPFPFTALLAHLERSAGNGADVSGATRRVLIPVGRSLQRDAAAPEHFASPRVVVAVDSQPAVRRGTREAEVRDAPVLHDRMFIGYQERADILEVISYNEAAGRFEFQVVRDYRAGGRPRLVYANRALCMSCHQNGGPIFSRGLWSETSANPGVEAALHGAGARRYGVEPGQGVDVPYAIDAATDRANLLGVYQWLWRNGCAVPGDQRRTVRCRAALVTAALQYRLSGGQGYDAAAPGYAEVLATVAANGRALSSARVAIPNPDLPNRDPLTGPGAAVAAGVPAAFDPLMLRAPLETWPLVPPEATVHKLVAGLASFFADADIARLDEHLAGAALAPAPARTAPLACESRWTTRPAGGHRLDLRCLPSPASGTALVGRVHVDGVRVIGGSFDRVPVVAAGDGTTFDVRDVDVTGGTLNLDAGGEGARLMLARGALHVRAHDGSRVQEIRLAGLPPRAMVGVSTRAATAQVVTLPDFAPVMRAVAGMADAYAGASGAATLGPPHALDDAPFRRVAILRDLHARLALPSRAWCCEDVAALPAPVAEPTPTLAATDPGDGGRALLNRHCALCHAGEDRFPPNFLAGNGAQVRARIAHCAPRIHQRLALWRVDASQRRESPMPPPATIADARSGGDASRGNADLAALTDYMANILQAEAGKPAPADDRMRGSYDRLRECLPGTG